MEFKRTSKVKPDQALFEDLRMGDKEARRKARETEKAIALASKIVKDKGRFSIYLIIGN